MVKTYEEMVADRKAKFSNSFEKKGVFARVKENLASRVLYTAAMVGTLVAAAEYHGALNSDAVKAMPDKVQTYVVDPFITKRLEKDKEALTGLARAIVDAPEEHDLGKVLYEKRQACEDLLKKEPNNNAAQKELTKLDLLIKVYEQTGSPQK